VITLAQPSLVLNSFGVASHYAFSMWRTWNMPQGATSKDVVYWIATACDQAPELALHHVVLHAHADDGIIYVGQAPDGSANSINPWNVADFQALASGISAASGSMPAVRLRRPMAPASVYS
jgi:hypothetical protein